MAASVLYCNLCDVAAYIRSYSRLYCDIYPNRRSKILLVGLYIAEDYVLYVTGLYIVQIFWMKRHVLQAVSYNVSITSEIS